MTRVPILLLAPHSRCNCRCVMCDIWRAPGRREITSDQVERWIPDMTRLGVERVVLTGGEALMHSDLWTLCDRLREAGIAITLLTTGLLLERDAIQVARVCDEVIVSVDGPPAVHDAIRRVDGAFDRMRRGIAAVRAAAETEVAAITINGRCTVQHANAGVLRVTVDAAAALPLDHISFLAADVTSAAFNRADGWTSERRMEVAVGPDDLPILEEQLACMERECAADFVTGFIVESPEKLRRRLLWHFQALHGLRPFPPQRCSAPWVSSVIEPDGAVRPCFFHRAIGNIHDAGGLDAVLNSAEARSFRRTLDVSTNAICQSCVCTLNRSVGEANHADVESKTAS
jgi:MoaA/NifB/PqqE/SkfB family radical SAM enzyme